MDPSIQERVPAEYIAIYRQHWHTIRPSVKQGVIKTVYHYPLVEDSNLEIEKLLDDILKNHSKIKINMAFGFILRQRSTDQLKFFHPSNNTMLFDTPRLITNVSDKRKLMTDVESQDAYEYARLQKPSSNWPVERIICVRFDVYKLLTRV